MEVQTGVSEDGVPGEERDVMPHGREASAAQNDAGLPSRLAAPTPLQPSTSASALGHGAQPHDTAIAAPSPVAPVAPSAAATAAATVAAVAVSVASSSDSDSDIDAASHLSAITLTSVAVGAPAVYRPPDLEAERRARYELETEARLREAERQEAVGRFTRNGMTLKKLGVAVVFLVALTVGVRLALRFVFKRT